MNALIVINQQDTIMQESEKLYDFYFSITQFNRLSGYHTWTCKTTGYYTPQIFNYFKGSIYTQRVKQGVRSGLEDSSFLGTGVVDDCTHTT